MNIASLGRIAALALVALWAAPDAPAGPKIGVLLKARNGFWDSVQKGAEDAAAKAGAEAIVKAPPEETDVAIQVRLLTALAGQGVQALVIAPCNADALATPVAALAAKGVKIVVIDSPLPASIPSVFVGTDHRAAGEAAGAYIAGLVADGDEVSLFRHNQNGGAAGEREQGAIDKLRAMRPHVILHGDVYASTEPGMETERSDFLLSKYPGTKAILAIGTPGTMAMLAVLADKNPPLGIKFAGFGYNLNQKVADALAKGYMQGWVAQQPKLVGSKGIETAVALIEGQTVPPIVHTDFVLVTKDNLQDPAVQALLQP
jgi:ribose transport system substrate-binding protein